MAAAAGERSAEHRRAFCAALLGALTFPSGRGRPEAHTGTTVRADALQRLCLGLCEGDDAQDSRRDAYFACNLPGQQATTMMIMLCHHEQ